MNWRWPWSRKQADVINTEAAQRALAEAQQENAKAKAQQLRVDQVSSETAKHARENNFSRLVEEAMHQRRRER